MPQYLLKSDKVSALHPWIREELTLAKSVTVGDSGDEVRKVQEWLCLRDFRVDIDGAFGPVTGHALGLFQESQGLKADGVAGPLTFAALVLPMRLALAPVSVSGLSLGQMLSLVAKAHLSARPAEAGGDNAGPWVRLYMRGHQGSEYRWCAGFVSFCLAQACELLGRPMPIVGSFGCDELVGQAKRAKCFVSNAGSKAPGLEVGSFFVERRRREAIDYIHVGIVVEVTSKGVYRTIEGNTNDEGSANGHEVCARWRGYHAFRDYIRF